MATEVTRLRPVGKTVIKLFINRHWEETGETLPEWHAFEILAERCMPDLWKKALEHAKKMGFDVSIPSDTED